MDTNNPASLNQGSELASDVAQFWHRLSKQPIVMLTDTFAGGLRARPMGARIREEENRIWFMTDRDSAKVADVLVRPDVCICVSDTGANLYMSITGRCSVVEDRQKIDELWSPADKIFFDGPDDPRIVLLSMEPSEGQVWSGPAGPIAAIKMMFAIVTGTKPDLGTMESVKL